MTGYTQFHVAIFQLNRDHERTLADPMQGCKDERPCLGSISGGGGRDHGDRVGVKCCGESWK